MPTRHAVMLESQANGRLAFWLPPSSFELVALSATLTLTCGGVGARCGSSLYA